MSEAIESFLPYVIPRATMCPEPLAIQSIRLAAIEFCRRTNVVRRVQSQNIVATTQDYTPTAVTDMVVARVLKSWVEGKLLDTASDVDDPTALVGANIGSATVRRGYPRILFFKTPVQLTTGVIVASLYPVPDTSITNGLTLLLSMQPSEASTTVEDVLFDDFHDAIASGALARITAVPNQTYSSNMAGDHRKEFLAACHAAKWRTETGSGQVSLRVEPRRFV